MVKKIYESLWLFSLQIFFSQLKGRFRWPFKTGHIKLAYRCAILNETFRNVGIHADYFLRITLRRLRLFSVNFPVQMQITFYV